MAIRLPVFNLVCDMWINGALPMAGPPDYTDIPCQVFVPPRGILDITPDIPTDWVPPIYIRTPKENYNNEASYFIIHGYDDQWYAVRWAMMYHLGFPNQYASYLCNLCEDDGDPSDNFHDG